MCSLDLTSMSAHGKQAHYDDHFEEQPQATKTYGAGYTKPVSKSKFKPPMFFTKGVSIEAQNVFWYSTQATEPPPNFSPGLIPVLKKALSKSHERGSTQRAWLACENAVHIQAEGWDRMWGCGYRNYLMACAALMAQQRQPMYFPLLDTPTPPGIRNLQVLLEEAWKNSFDEEGAEQLHYKLVETTKWIGTADLNVAFTYRGIPANLADFSDLKKGVDPLLQWIYNYFSGGDPQPKSTTVGEALRGARPVIVTDKLPIVLQYQGHSRTIVGCERAKNGSINLLEFDPSKRIPSNIRQAGLRYHDPQRLGEAASSSSRVLHKVMHPVETMKSKKRKSVERDAAVPKRKRLSDPGDVIDISDTEEEKPPAGPSKAPVSHDEPDFGAVLKFFRVSLSSLNKKNKYQILYFPLEEPLTEQEKLRRRIVTSEKVA
ncbi:uncharacterized protein TRAVEDRAFT_164804 [Trametes versicolor FP-101664 SS1]|uniref:uncharacterized protein n=1 Tax=Trametes versicolor (strain FP-101664) TaxID=717944 RepID=UPI00046240F4|nr:uncharacterized protein TRAVEDRAFT_164804 [Trametes versicolor FP-101664 SS1]EIW60199.1 hypothetical protein TRAVEDRAFT_164804 [Trametes versicolor FP-101664 SS1]